jgi:hypothetical protein
LDTITLFLRAQFEHEILLLNSKSLYDGGVKLEQDDSSPQATYSIIRSQNLLPSRLPDLINPRLFFLVREESSTKRINRIFLRFHPRHAFAQRSGDNK